MEELVFVLLQRSTDGDANIGRFRLSVTTESGETVRSVKTSPLEEIAAARAKAGRSIPNWRNDFSSNTSSRTATTSPPSRN